MVAGNLESVIVSEEVFRILLRLRIWMIGTKKKKGCGEIRHFLSTLGCNVGCSFPRHSSSNLMEDTHFCDYNLLCSYSIWNPIVIFVTSVGFVFRFGLKSFFGCEMWRMMNVCTWTGDMQGYWNRIPSCFTSAFVSHRIRI